MGTDMKQLLLLAVLLLLLFSIPASLCASEHEEKMPPLPSGLSKDTQFIIYYVDKRISMLEREMDKRFEAMQQTMDKRFEQVDKRFKEMRQDMNKRFEEMFNFLWILTAIFTSLTAVVIGFAYWDRRTIIRQARNEAIERIEKEGRLQDFIRALRAFAKENSEFAKILKQFNLL